MHYVFRPALAFGLVLATASAHAQQAPRVTISGYVRDAATGENLIGVAVVNPATGQGTATNTYGFYSLTLPAVAADSVRVLASYLGYERGRWVTPATRSATHDFRLRAASSELGEVTVIGSQATEERIERTTRMSTINVPIAQIKSLPKLFGEVDVLKVLQLLPGVQSGGEGQTGLYVRGGSPDQNLILLDGTPVYNASHLFGFFSVFNADALNNVELIKGGFPARYGGRLSSVLDISMKEGNMQEFHGEGAVGIIASKITLEGPIKKDTASFIVSARRTYLDVLAQPFIKSQLAAEGSQGSIGYFFHDLNAKLNWKVSGRDRLYLSAYTGYDKFYARIRDKERSNGDYSRTEASLGWGNLTSALRWNHVVNSQLFANLTAVASKYDYNLGVPEGKDAFDWKSNVVNYSLKADFNYYRSPQSTLNFGVGALYYTFLPGQVKPGAGSVFRELKLDKQYALEYAAYLDHEQTFSPSFTAQYGVRLTMFDYLGPGTVYDYEGTDGRQKTPVNPRQYADGKVIKRYPNVEPRASLRYTLSETSSLKASYNRMVQYVHLISNTTASSPLDVWTPSTTNIKPEKADQVALGYFRNFRDNAYEASVEVYGKRMDNQIDYINGANTLLNKDLEAELLYGQGRAYGAEFYVKKNEGPLTGWVSYTLSRSERQIDALNNGDWYVNKYDKTHYLAVVGLYEWNKRWTVSGTFNYSTGIATTFPDSRYNYQGLTVPNVNGDVRNNYRVPAYHRLDLAATLQGKRNAERKWQSYWVFSVYNVYGRRNPYSIYFRQNKDNPNKTEAVRLSVLGSALPSVSYNFSF